VSMLTLAQTWERSITYATSSRQRWARWQLLSRIDSDVVTLVETVAGLVLQMLLSRRRTSVGAMRPAYVHWLPFTWAYY
jgi:hypothetical protein